MWSAIGSDARVEVVGMASGGHQLGDSGPGSYSRVGYQISPSHIPTLGEGRSGAGCQGPPRGLCHSLGSHLATIDRESPACTSEPKMIALDP